VFKENIREINPECEMDIEVYKCYSCDGYLTECLKYVPIKKIRERLKKYDGVKKYV
jgi:hypothetical protein